MTAASPPPPAAAPSPPAAGAASPPPPAAEPPPAKSRLDRFETLTKSVLNVVLLFGAVAGGLWAFSQFFLTEQLRRSALELDQLERAQREASAPELTIEARQAHLGGERGCAIAGEVGFRNRTACDILLDYREIDPLLVGRAALVDGTFTFQEVALHPLRLPHHPELPWGPEDEPVIEVGMVTLPPGRPLEIPFLIPVSRPGLYVVMLSPERSDRSAPADGSGAAAPIDSLVWLNAVLVEIEAGRGCA